MINTMGIYMLQTQEATIKEHIRKNIKTHVNSLICWLIRTIFIHSDGLATKKPLGQKTSKIIHAAVTSK